MDLNGDGNLDILSGSYSRMDRDMAGLFQVLWGKEDHKFEAPEALTGSDDNPLILPGDDEATTTDRICTRPTAADIDGDGDLDLIVGNFSGSFFMFTAEETGKYNPEAVKLEDNDGKALMVPQHSDPFVIDWDRDGDLDLVSGSAQGGVFLSINDGSATEPAFSAFKPLLKPKGYTHGDAEIGDDHITGPQTATRVWVDDINDDGKWDVLIGDSATINSLAEGIDEEEAKKKLDEISEKQAEGSKKMAELQEIISKYPEKLEAKRKEMMRQYEEEARKAKEDAEDSSDEDESSDDVEDEDPSDKADAEKQEDVDSEEAKADAEFEKAWKEQRELGEVFGELYDARKGIIQSKRTGYVWVMYGK